MFDPLVNMVTGFTNQLLPDKNSQPTGKNADISESFEFVDGENFTIPPPFSASNKKRWTEDDQKIIISLLEEIRTIAPGLMQLATIGGPIKLVRFEEIEHPAGKYPCGLTSEQTIIITDVFFKTQSKLRSLAHEIVHLADSDSHFAAFTKEWVQLAEPLTLKLKGLTTIDERRDFLRTHWPSEYACENLHEALAEYVAAYVDGEYFESKEEFERTVAPLILEPSSEGLKWKHLVTEVTKARNSTNLKLARTILQKTARMFPSKPYSHLHLAGISATNGDLKSTKSHTKNMLETFGAIGSSQMIEKEYLQLISRTFFGCGKEKDAQDYLKWITTIYSDRQDLSRC